MFFLLVGPIHVIGPTFVLELAAVKIAPLAIAIVEEVGRLG